jgi:EmrB/QacA subfamily drug resistance transporter
MTSLLRRMLAEPAPLDWLVTRPWHPWLVVGLVSIGAFVGQLDATIVQLALPTLGRTFAAPLQEVSWVALSYLLAFASFLPIFGRLCEMVGRKSLYLVGYAVFIAASALCGLAETFDQLLAFRFLQGVGGALLGANSISILVRTVPTASRGRALGVFAAAQAVGMSTGPALGGLILASLDWRWIFWITVPFGAVAVVLGWLALPRTSGPPSVKTFDWGGALLIGPALILLVTTLNHVSSWGLLSVQTLGSLVVTAVLFLLLARRERGSRSPLIEPRLIAVAAFRSGALAVCLAYALLYATFFLMSFVEEHGYGESPAAAGLRLAIIPIALGVTAPFSHDARAWLGARTIGIAGMSLCLAAIAIVFLTTGASPGHHLLHTLAYALTGVGLGLFIAPNSNATIGAAPGELSGAAGSLLNLMRVLGTSLGVAAGATTLSWRLAVETGTHGAWVTADPASLVIAFRESLPVLAVLAVAAAVASRLATSPSPPQKGA